jgi:hypothetical protein
MDCMLFTNLGNMSTADDVIIEEGPEQEEEVVDAPADAVVDAEVVGVRNNASVDESDKAYHPPPLLYITCGQPLPPALMWLEAEETSDGEYDGMCAAFDFQDACSGLTWTTKPAIAAAAATEESGKTRQAATETEQSANEDGFFASFWDGILNACGFRTAPTTTPPKQGPTSAWI